MLTCPGGLQGATLRFDGLGPIASEAVLYHLFADGRSRSHLVTPEHPTWTVPPPPRDSIPGSIQWTAVARDYVALGVRHILGGADHLLFLLALVLVLRRPRAVLLAESAFTLSHSLSFSASALGFVHLSSRAAEAAIALSLLLVALDIPFNQGSPSDSARRDGSWARRGAGLAFVFGLVHGLGFAGGLSEIGLPAGAIPAALIGFAAGVETGQIAFLTLALFAFLLIAGTRLERIATALGCYAVGGVGCFWLLSRLQALFGTAF